MTRPSFIFTILPQIAFFIFKQMSHADKKSCRVVFLPTSLPYNRYNNLKAIADIDNHFYYFNVDSTITYPLTI